MERKDLLQINGKIFKSQGEALNQVAKPDCKICVVANPANTNCMLLSKYATRIPSQNFTCLTRLDQNRALSQIAIKSNSKVSDVSNIIIWGNHSSTQYPDVNQAFIGEKKVREVINDDEYLNGEFISRVQKRGAEIISVKKTSSVFSAANAVKDHLRDWFNGNNNLVSMGVVSQGQYGINQGLVFSYPCRMLGNFQYEVVESIHLDSFSQEKLKITEQELLEEQTEALAE